MPEEIKNHFEVARVRKKRWKAVGVLDRRWLIALLERLKK
jgi:hypothetical protein